ncbi:MAG TPA: ATP-grasp domain-containing protein [Pyrinomonadaceae bacterium]|nr:ATP-grasp domain-containing protein [Pyrinomonadaceae bacterium]
MRRIMFVCRALTGEALRCANAIQDLDDVTLLTVEGVDHARQLIDAARAHGSVDRIVTAQETLLAPVAEANEALNLDAMRSEVVTRTLDKAKLKSILERAGLKTPRDRVIATVDDARRFVNEIGFPIVMKPMNGSGAITTFRITTDEELTSIVKLIDGPVIAQAYIHGQELCFDTVTIDDEPQCYAVCCYDPPIIEAVEDPQKQWRCIMPRELDAFEDFIRDGLKAVRALEVGSAVTHMEGFIDSGFIDATLRPAGARIGPMFGWAFDVDPYRLWARVVVDGAFDGPLERKYAVGTIFLRGAGSGYVEVVDGLEEIQQQLDRVIVEARFPKIGVAKSATYTGDGFITVRHADTAVVQNALDLIERTIRITYTGADTQQPNWGHRLQHFKDLNRPAWENTT